jgi:hypothetical protein
MDGCEQHELNDTVLEKEIEAAIRVDPSPEFLARVRARIAGEPLSKGWGWYGTREWATAAAALMLVAIAGVWTLRDPAPIPREARLNAPPDEAAHRQSEVLKSSADPVKGASPPAVRTARSLRRPLEPRPEVVVSPDEAVALRQLMAAIAARQVEAVDIPTLGADAAPLPPIEEILLEPMTLSPIAGLDGE